MMPSAAVTPESLVGVTGEPLIRLQGVSGGYNGKAVLHEVSLAVRRGELVGIVGPNGAGKSTLLKILLGLLTPMSGTMEMFGRRIRDAGDRAWMQKRIGYLAQIQEPPAIPVTVADTVLLGRWGRSFAGLRRPGAADREVVRRHLELTGIAELAKRDLRSLSGGQRQRAALARALAREPELLLMDEPTTYLDKHARNDLMRRILDIHSESGITMLLVTHVELPGREFDRVLHLDEGLLDRADRTDRTDRTDRADRADRAASDEGGAP